MALLGNSRASFWEDKLMVSGVYCVIVLWQSSDGLSSKRRHTSIVVFGKEIFYGRGIITTGPGQSHVRNFETTWM